MTPTDTAGEASVLPGMIDVVVGIVTAGFMSNPFIVGVNVGSFRMSLLVREPAVFLGGRLLGPGRLFSARRRLGSGRLLSPRRRGTMSRNMSAANVTTAALMLLSAPVL